MQTIPVFVISMKSALARRASIERHLRALGIEYEMFDAVRGTDLDATRAREVNPNGNLSPGSVGTYLSHMGVYELMLTRGLEVALILEDDAMLLDGARELLVRGCRNLEFDLCYLGCDDAGDIGFVYLDTAKAIELTDSHRAYPLSAGPYCLHAYLMTRAGAEKRLANAYPARTPIDHYGRLPCSLRFVALQPMIAFVNEQSAVGSVTTANWSGLKSQLRQRWWFYPLRDILKLRRLRKWLARRDAAWPHEGHWRPYRSALRVLRGGGHGVDASC